MDVDVDVDVDVDESIIDRFLLLPLLIAISCSGGGSSSDTSPPPDLPDIPYIDAASDDSGVKNHPPVLAKIGDRKVSVGQKLMIALSATDPDNDPLTFAVYGDIPDGAKFDKETSTFSWVPLQEGLKVYLTFTVSDGHDLDRETVQIEVVPPGAGHPPVFLEVSDQKIQAGVPFSLQLQASDPDGDALQFGIQGEKPEGASLNAASGLFAWTPKTDKVIVKVVFVVSDGVFKDTMEVRFIVGEAGGGPPQFQPVPLVTAEAGKPVSFVVKATDPDGDAVTLAVKSGMLAGATFDSDSGKFAWTPGDADSGKHFEVEFSATDGQFTSFMTVAIDVAKPAATCVKDQFESNDTPALAPSISPGVYDLSICDVDPQTQDIDFLQVAAKQGETITAVVTFDHAKGDIDCDISDDGSEATILVASNGSTGQEKLVWTATKTKDYWIAIYGVAGEKYASPYKLDLKVEAAAPACTDDSLEENDGAGAATEVSGTEASWKELVLCPGDDDWFAVTLGAGDDLLAAATPKTGKLGMKLLAPGGQTVLDEQAVSGTPATVALEDAKEAGKYLVGVYSPDKADYTFEVLVEKAKPGCDSKSCPKQTVCDSAKGKCVLDLCDTSADCPDGLPCMDTYCVDPCKTQSDCRKDYVCKAFPEGTYCGVTLGKSESGDPCTYFSQCAGERVCLFHEKGGYCAVWGCESDWDCPLDSWCTDAGAFSFCAAQCTADSDCNQAGGFGCKNTISVDGMDVGLCL